MCASRRLPRHYSVGVTARPASPQALGAVRSPTLWHGGARVAPPGRGTAVRRRPCPGPPTPCRVCACWSGVGHGEARWQSRLAGSPAGLSSDAQRPPRPSRPAGDWPPPDLTPRRPAAWSAGSGSCAPSRRRPVGAETPQSRRARRRTGPRAHVKPAHTAPHLCRRLLKACHAGPVHAGHTMQRFLRLAGGAGAAPLAELGGARLPLAAIRE